LFGVAWAGMVQAQTVPERTDYSFKGFSGLNLMRDSVDLAPGEAVQLDNFMLDRFGVLHKRYGVQNWNDSLLSGGHIRDIHYVDDGSGNKSIFFIAYDDSTSNYVLYRLPGWTDTTTSWYPLRVGYENGEITQTVSATKTIIGTSTKWMLRVSPGDVISWNGNIRTVSEVYNDTSFGVTTAISDDATNYSYKIFKTTTADASLSTWNGQLFVADAEGLPWVFKDSIFTFLIFVDSGTVDTTFSIEDTLLPWYGMQTPKYQVYPTLHIQGDRVVSDTNLFDDTFNNGAQVDSVGNLFCIDLFIYTQRKVNAGKYFFFRSPIKTVNAYGNVLVLEDEVIVENFSNNLVAQPSASALNFSRYGNYEIHYNVYSPTGQVSTYTTDAVIRWYIKHPNTGHATTIKEYLSDQRKSYIENYAGFYIMNSNNATYTSEISESTGPYIYYDSTLSFDVGDKYYIFQKPPYSFVTYRPNFGDTLQIDQTYYSQIYFWRNRMYAIGKRLKQKLVKYPWVPADTTESDSTNYERVWYSDLALPQIVYPDYNFDITGAHTDVDRGYFTGTRCRSFFGLRDVLYVITDNNIFAISGEPEPTPDNFYITRVINGVGTNQPRGTITTKNKHAYIMNTEGIWRFDGRIIEKISYRIDPLIEQYRNSSMVAGQFKDNLFFSYPDSDITVVLHEPTQAFTLWDFGMECMNNQFVAIDSNYFLFWLADFRATVGFKGC
jgi:hypothetical protein